MKDILKNKKGDISVTLLVLLTVTLCISSIFIFFYYDRSTLEDISGFNSISVYSNEKIIYDYYLKSIAQNSIKYLQEQNIAITPQNFLTEFKKEYLQNSLDAKVSKEYENQDDSQITNGVYVVSILEKNNEKILSFTLKDLKFTKSYAVNEFYGITSISKIEDLSFEISL
jgi:uncharacterized protein (UPF0333 family)